MKDVYLLLRTALTSVTAINSAVAGRISMAPLPADFTRPCIELQRLPGGGRDKIATDWHHPLVMVRVWSDDGDEAERIMSYIDDYFIDVKKAQFTISSVLYTLVHAEQVVSPGDQVDLDSKANTSWGTWRITFF